MDIDLLKIIADKFNSYLRENDLESYATFKWRNLINTDNIITNNPCSKKLKNLVFDEFFKQDELNEYCHFTSLDSLMGIVEQECVRLTAVTKRYGEKEFKPFYQKYGMDGFNSLGKGEIPLYDILVNDSFYISLTRADLSSNDEDYMLKAFGKAKHGVKLTFEINSIHTHLRQVFYEERSQKLLHVLDKFSSIVAEYGKVLVVPQISVIGFFYLPSQLSSENEHRLLVKRETAEHFKLNSAKDSDGFDFIELPLFESPLANVKLKSILVDKTNYKIAKSILQRNQKFSEVEVLVKQ